MEGLWEYLIRTADIDLVEIPMKVLNGWVLFSLLFYVSLCLRGSALKSSPTYQCPLDNTTTESGQV